MSKSFTLPGSYVDAKNNKYANSIVLQPYSSAVLIKTFDAAGTVNKAPSVTISTPVDSATFNSPATITINATASDNDGSVTKVDFYNGNTLLGSDNTSPYSFAWNNVAAGNYSITAKATDNDGAVTISAAIAISILKPNAAPTVNITSPANNASFNSLASIIINSNCPLYSGRGIISKQE